MSAVPTRACPRCQRRLIGRMGTDGRGNLVETWPRCPCEDGAAALDLGFDDLPYEERAAAARRTGICMDCFDPVEGRKGWALRCARHKQAARASQESAYRKTAEGRAKRRKYERRKRRNKAFRERRNARARELHAERMANDPAYAEAYRRRRQRESSIRHPSYRKRIAYFERTNAVRGESKREHARRRYYERHPVRPDPHCATRGDRIDWRPGKGRPPKYHQTSDCNPFHTPRKARAA